MSRSGDLMELIEELRRIERRRNGATPASAEYMELVGFERGLLARLQEIVERLDRAGGLPGPMAAPPAVGAPADGGPSAG